MEVFYRSGVLMRLLNREVRVRAISYEGYSGVIGAQGVSQVNIIQNPLIQKCVHISHSTLLGNFDDETENSGCECSRD